MTTQNINDIVINQGYAWYVIRTFPGIELKTKTRLVNTLRAKDLTQTGMQIIVPHDVMVDDHDRKPLAGFIVVKMRMQADTWKAITNAPGVTGYIGSGVIPTAYPIDDWTQIPFSRFPE
jgi:transcriptional antiterminator NusG